MPESIIDAEYCVFCRKITHRIGSDVCNHCKRKEEDQSESDWMELSSKEKVIDLYNRIRRLEMQALKDKKLRKLIKEGI